jgi:SAM-dependent methyltransferase
MDEYIDPKRVMREVSVEKLCETADGYFRGVSDFIPLWSKPLHAVDESSYVLFAVAQLLSGLRLERGMHVLDFGAGSCWLSRMFNQLGCSSVSVDCSKTALDIGRQLFEQLPVLGGSIRPPQFLPFDGRRIDLPSESVDRIVCCASFHHVPNPAEVLREFHRVLRCGGIAAFAEPGPTHSRSSDSQSVMREFNVLENDIVVDDIWLLAQAAGFTEINLKLAADPAFDITLDDYRQLLESGKLSDAATRTVAKAQESATVFFLVKGDSMPDSRNGDGLACKITANPMRIDTKVGTTVDLTLNLHNTGKAKWLHSSVGDVGVVLAGIHLYLDGELVDFDFAHGHLRHTVLPGSAVEICVRLPFTRPGRFELVIDMVAHQVGWFEHLGSSPPLRMEAVVSE